jgi:chitin synthase
LLVVNPYKALANVNDVSAKEYEERSYKVISLPMLDSPRPLQPHLYDVAARVYLLMRRRNESQAVVSRFVTHLVSFAFTDVVGNRDITGSGKPSSQRLFLNQILRLSTYSKKVEIG